MSSSILEPHYSQQSDDRDPLQEPCIALVLRDCLEMSTWDDQYSALPETMGEDKTLSQHLQNLFQEEIPTFYNILDRETFRSARVNQTWPCIVVN